MLPCGFVNYTSSSSLQGPRQGSRSVSMLHAVYLSGVPDGVLAVQPISRTSAAAVIVTVQTTSPTVRDSYTGSLGFRHGFQ